MPTIIVEQKDLESLLGLALPKTKEKINNILAFVKGEVKKFSDQEIHIELNDSNRADLWSAEGISRALRGILNIERGMRNFKIKGKSGVEISVDAKLLKIRPFIACAIIKSVNLSEASIRQLMQLQEKLDQTYGRQRRRTSIGLYDFDLVKPPLFYTVAKPQDISFVPLNCDKNFTLEEIIEKHPKGIEYGQIICQNAVWPIFMDSKEKVLSFPPIINSNDLGHITENTKNVLIEVTGTNLKNVSNTLLQVTLALVERKGSVFSTVIHYPYGKIKDRITPEIKTKKITLDVDFIREILGLKLSLPEIRDFLERSRYGVMEATESRIEVKIPCYRGDVMHPIDLVEDIAIAFNYNKMFPSWPRFLTIGDLSQETKFRNIIREIMIGTGFQEILTLTLSNPEVLFSKMNKKSERIVKIANPNVIFLNCLRNWLLPSLMEFLNHNIHVEYPQKIFEVGNCIIHDERKETKTRDIEKLACVTTHSNANFTEIKSTLDILTLNLGLQYKLKETKLDSLIIGRAGRIIVEKDEIGFIGEIHPQVLNNWNLENPAATFEINISKVFQIINKLKKE
jgi:phenylalanyl-tRNA synthetase beta chain